MGARRARDRAERVALLGDRVGDAVARATDLDDGSFEDVERGARDGLARERGRVGRVGVVAGAVCVGLACAAIGVSVGGGVAVPSALGEATAADAGGLGGGRTRWQKVQNHWCHEHPRLCHHKHGGHHGHHHAPSAPKPATTQPDAESYPAKPDAESYPAEPDAESYPAKPEETETETEKQESESETDESGPNAANAKLGHHKHKEGHGRFFSRVASWLQRRGRASEHEATKGESASASSERRRKHGHLTSILGYDRKLNVRTYIVADTRPGKESETAMNARDYITDLFKTYGGMTQQQAGEMVEIQKATFPTAWPVTLDVAQYSTSDLMTTPEKGGRMPGPMNEVKQVLDSKDHVCRTDSCLGHREHHFGCLLSHMAVWKKALERGEERVVLWEQDGRGIHSVSPLDYSELGRQLPADADMVWLVNTARGPGQFVKKFRSKATGKWGMHTQGLSTPDWAALGDALQNANTSSHVYLYKWDKLCMWAGAGSLMFTKKGLERLREHVKHKGAGMVDAWLAGECITRRADGLNLRCYHATTTPFRQERVGGYLPNWYLDPKVNDASVPQSQLDAIDADPTLYNSLGCARGGNEYREHIAWLPIGEGQGKDTKVWGCHPPDWKGVQLNGCDANLKLPINPKVLQRTAGVTLKESARLGVYKTGVYEAFTAGTPAKKPTLGATSTLPHIYIIADTTPGEESETAIDGRQYIVDLLSANAGMSMDDAQNSVEISRATFPTRWPDTFDVAQYATAGLFTPPLGSSEGGQGLRMPFDEVYAAESRDDHVCVTPSCTQNRHHHLGAKLSHMAVWKKALERGDEHIVVWEQDGRGIHSVSPLDYAELGRQLPADTDMVWLVNTARGPGQFVKKFRSKATGTWGDKTQGATRGDWIDPSTRSANDSKSVYLYKFDRLCGWAGAGALMLTKRGMERLSKYGSEKGVDMIDAWLAGRCIATGDGLDLKCYTAMTAPISPKNLGGYVPEWYSDVNVDEGTVPQEQIDEIERDPHLYNRLGCERGGAEFEHTYAWLPVGTVDQTRNCHTPSGEAAARHGFKACDPNQELPIKVETLWSSRASSRANARLDAELGYPRLAV